MTFIPLRDIDVLFRRSISVAVTNPLVMMAAVIGAELIT